MSDLPTLPNVSLVNGTPVVSSLTVAEHFDKRHADVLRAIENLKSELEAAFSQRNFALADYIDEQGKPRPSFNLTRDGFTLLVMGFTGAKALAWKVRYIEAFNSMERQLLHLQETIASECAKHIATAFRQAKPAALPRDTRPVPWAKQARPHNAPGQSLPGVHIDTHPDHPHVVLDMGGYQFRIVEADGWRWWNLSDVAGSIGKMNGARGWARLPDALREFGGSVEQARYCTVRPLGDNKRAWRGGCSPSSFLREDGLLSWLGVQHPARVGHRLTEIGSIAKLGLPA